MFEYELAHACYKIVTDMFKLQPGQTIVITCDTASSMEVVDAAAQAAVIVGAKPVVIKFPTPRGVGKAADPDLSIDTLVGALRHADAWVEFNYQWLLYSTVYDEVMLKSEIRPKFLCMVGATPEMVVRLIGKVDLVVLKQFMLKLVEATKAAREFRVTTPAGTDLTYRTLPERDVRFADGDIGPGQVKMVPGQMGYTPDFDSINGVMVIDGALSPPIGKITNPIKLTVEKGFIKKIEGEGTDAKVFESWLASFNHPNMYRLAHISYGLNPNALLTGDIVEDERVWGSTEWGFGNVGYMFGYEAPSHSDGINLNSSLWMDGVQVLDKGTYVGPTEEILELVRKLGK